MNVLLPAFGKPTRATSALNFNSRLSHRSSPTSPCSANDGARRRLDRKRALPRPPWPPLAASHRSPVCTRSASSPPSRSRTTVPSGTRTIVSSPDEPWRAFPLPWTPLPARRGGGSRKPSSEAGSRAATNHTSPPPPPSPPSGPPRGTCASRPNETAPAPPSPPFPWTWASSTNAGTVKQPRRHCFRGNVSDPQPLEEVGRQGVMGRQPAHRRLGEVLVGQDGLEPVETDPGAALDHLDLGGTPLVLAE